MENKALLGFLIAALCIGFIAQGVMVTNSLNSDGISEEQVAKIVGDEISKIEIPELVNPEQASLDLTEFNAKIEEMKLVIDSIVDEDKISEAKAEELALEEVVMDRSFRRLIRTVLNGDNETVEDYRDIVEIYNIKVEEVDLVNDTVVIEFKVRYYNDGDDEEEDLQRAKLSVTFDLVGLDYDDEYEDAEVVEEKLSVLKIYE